MQVCSFRQQYESYEEPLNLYIEQLYKCAVNSKNV